MPFSRQNSSTSFSVHDLRELVRMRVLECRERGNVRVQLDLVDGGNDGGFLEEKFQPRNGDVGDSDGLDLFGVLLVEFFHLGPSVDPVDLWSLIG